MDKKEWVKELLSYGQERAVKDLLSYGQERAVMKSNCVVPGVYV